MCFGILNFKLFLVILIFFEIPTIYTKKLQLIDQFALSGDRAQKVCLNLSKLINHNLYTYIMCIC